MNFQLLDILACPIDKESPLKLYIFSVNTTQEELDQISSLHDESNIEIIRKDEKFFLKDKIISKSTPLEEYFNQIQSQIDLLEQIVNYSTNMDINKYIKKIKSEVKKRLVDFSATHQKSQIEKILPDLFLLNKFLLEVKVNTGVLLCPKCNRWYPIFNAIPQLLPDEQRNIKEEIRRFASEIEKFNQFKKENNISI